jgi:exosortase
MNAELAERPPTSLSGEMLSVWNRLPNKGFFLILLAGWCALFQWLGNSVFGYLDTHSLFYMLWKDYTVETDAADDSHGILIPFVVLALFWWKRGQLLAQPLRIWWPGTLLLALGLLLHFVGYAVQQPRISVIALFTGIYGLMGMAWGPAWLRTCFFPFFLFAFCVPLGTLAEPVTFPLRLMVSKLVAFIGQNIFGIDVVSEGTRLFKMPWRYEYEVAAACSGIHSLMAITAIAIIYAFVVFPEWWKRVVLIGSALPLAVIGNTFRMLTIILAAEWRGQEYGNSVHSNVYWSLLPYVPAIGGLILIGRWLENRQPPRTATGTGATHEPLAVP